MKIEKYEMTVTTDVIHGWKTRIIEFWIPPVKGKHKGIIFNFHGDEDNKVLMWFGKEPRYKIKETNGTLLSEEVLEDNIANTMYDCLKLRQQVNSYGQLKKMAKVIEQKEKAESKKNFANLQNGIMRVK